MGTSVSPLTGRTVLDLTRLLPGPYASRLLAELGAEVIKIEDPNGGDYARWFPPLVGEPPVSGIFRELNAGKKSVALDLKQPPARMAFQRLAAKADVIVETFRPGVMTRLGLDPAELMKANPRLVYCAITGFGQTGPDALRAGHDIGYLARSGALGLSGSAERPVVPGVQVADQSAAFAAVAGVLAALLERERTGEGTFVDIALTESASAMASASFGQLHGGADVVRGREMLDGSRPCYSIYRTKDDRFLAVGALEPKFWSAFLGALGLEELMGSAMDVGEAGERVKARIQAVLETKTQAEWTEVFREVEACVEPVLDLAEVEPHPQAEARGIRSEGGYLRSPLRLSDGPGEASADAALEAAPALGADTEAVLVEAGLSAEEIAALIRRFGT